MALVTVLQTSTPVAADNAMECRVQKSTHVELSARVQEQVRVTNLALELKLGFAFEDAVELDSVKGRGVAAPACY